MISTTEENFERLGKEDNASKLINELLDVHYHKVGKSQEQILKEVQDKIADKELKARIDKERHDTIKKNFLDFFVVDDTQAEACTILLEDLKAQGYSVDIFKIGEQQNLILKP